VVSLEHLSKPKSVLCGHTERGTDWRSSTHSLWTHVTAKAPSEL